MQNGILKLLERVVADDIFIIVTLVPLEQYLRYF